MGRREGLRYTWGRLGMWDSCVIRSHLLEIPGKLKDPWVINFFICSPSCDAPSCKHTQTHTTYSPPQAGSCVGSTFQGHAEWTFVGTAFSPPQTWQRITEAGCHPSKWLHWEDECPKAVSWLVPISPLVGLQQRKEETHMTGTFRIKLPPEDHRLPLLGSVPMEHTIVTSHMWIGRLVKEGF